MEMVRCGTWLPTTSATNMPGYVRMPSLLGFRRWKGLYADAVLGAASLQHPWGKRRIYNAFLSWIGILVVAPGLGLGIDTVSVSSSFLLQATICSSTPCLVCGLQPIFSFFLQAKLQATWLVLGTSFMVAFTNAAINKITKLMGVFEKHKSVDKQEVRRQLPDKFTFPTVGWLPQHRTLWLWSPAIYSVGPGTIEQHRLASILKGKVFLVFLKAKECPGFISRELPMFPCERDAVEP